ncbi:MAG: hypothetical protein E7054_05055 [Lentisphaerae bacterium]|nr:hypothetical protein [Lentisphaerota bacterium]
MKHSIFNFQYTPEKMEEHALRIFNVRLQKRQLTADPEVEITVVRNPRCTPEEFRLSGLCNSKKLQLDCGSPAAFLYAVGKLLRTGNYVDSIFTPGNWRGIWKPAKSFRCIYFASHFYNVYEVAPVEEMEEYIEDLALQGYNNFQLTAGSAAKIAGSPETVNDLNRRKRLWKYAMELGMGINIGVSNNGYADSPMELRATPTGHSFFGTEICPSNPDGMEYLLKKIRSFFDELEGIKISTVKFWPYDQGGCGCEKCFPYGINGMFKLADKVVPLIREYWPDAKIIWTTWEFDFLADLGEWETLYKKINNGEADFIDLIMADSHGSFPEYPLTHPLPGKTELITFPEITMWGRAPWGGFGATPLPKRFSNLFGEISHLANGGILYSEGIFEDFNKVLYSDFFVTGQNSTEETIQEYARYYLGIPDDALDDFKRLLELMEENHEGVIWIEPQEEANDSFEMMSSKPLWRLKGKTWKNTVEMLAIAEKIDSKLPQWSKKCWRWRLLYLRAVIDFELAQHNNETNEVTEKAMLEIVDIYHVDPKTASRRVTPFTDAWIEHHVEEKYKLNRNTIGVD